MCMFLGLQIQPLAQRVAREYVVPGSQAVAQKVPSQTFDMHPAQSHA